MDINSKPVNEIEDATVAAFLAYRGYQVIPLKHPNGRVIFEVHGDISRDVEALYTNETVRILDYIRVLKSLRSSIFALKAVRQRNDD